MAPFWGSRLVWIDSVCINQKDPLDKNQQVALMSKIYQQATRTLAWLGDSPTAEYAVLQLYRLQPAVMNNQKWTEVLEMMKQKVLGTDTPPNWSALSELLSHQYWTRVWIVQELAVSKDVYIIYGTHYIPLGTISEAAHVLTCILNEYNKGEHFQMKYGFERANHRIRPLQKIDQRILNLLNIRIISGFRELIQKGQYPELWRAVVVTYLFDATDPRDKIYAFYNIATYSTETGLKADYTISVNDVYTRFTKHYISAQFQNLFFAAGNCRPRQLHGLPSWVPDFTSSNSLQLPFLGGGQDLKDGYTASGEHHQATIAPDSSNEIRLRGVYVDTVTHLTLHAIEPSGDEVRQPLISPAVHAWHEEAVSLVLANIPQNYRYYEESRRQAFIRTLIEDRNSDGSEAQRVYAKYYKHWCHFLKLSADSGPKALELPTSNEPAEKKQAAEIFASAVLRAGKFRRFAITREGYMALVPKEVEVGDVVWVVAGLQVPVVLRPIGIDMATKERVYTLVGWCYCHGIMMGEAVKSGEFENFILR